MKNKKIEKFLSSAFGELKYSWIDFDESVKKYLFSRYLAAGAVFVICLVATIVFLFMDPDKLIKTPYLVVFILPLLLLLSAFLKYIDISKGEFDTIVARVREIKQVKIDRKNYKHTFRTQIVIQDENDIYYSFNSSGNISFSEGDLIAVYHEKNDLLERSENLYEILNLIAVTFIEKK